MAIIQPQLLLNQRIVEQENATVVFWVSVTILSLTASVTAVQARTHVPWQDWPCPCENFGS